MRIALFTDTYQPQTNGVVSFLSDSIRLLQENNEVILFAPGEGKFRIEQVSTNFRIYWIPSRPFPFYDGYRIASFNYKRVSDLLAEVKPDIVHAHAPVMLGLQGVIAAKRKKIPVVITYHTHFPDYVPHLLSGKLPEALNEMSQYTAKKLIKHVFKRADVVTAPTLELVGELRSYGLPNVIHLPNGVDLKKISIKNANTEEFVQLYKIPENRKIVLYLGRISFEKKLDQLLEAFKMIEKADRMLLIVGGGPYLDNFRKFSDALGLKNVIFTGFIEQKHICSAYACSDLFVSASDTETFGLTFVEAMHMGLPAIGVRRFGAKELIIDGKTGLLVKPGDVKGLADAMEKLVSDDELRKEMGKDAVKRAADYSLEKSIRKTLEIYSKLVES